MTAQVIEIRGPSLKALTDQTKAAWDRADQKHADADDWYVRTGKLLLDLKERTPHGEWLTTLKRLGRSDRRELMELAGDPKILERQRERKRKHARKTAKKAKSNRRYSADAQPHYEEPEGYFNDADGMPPLAERWQYSLSNLCGEIISRRAYWNKEFAGWKSFECPSHVKKLVREAATEFAALAAEVTKR